MIQGLHFDITSHELGSLLDARVEHHLERSTFYQRQARELRDGMAESAAFTGGDPIRSLSESQAKHEEAVATLGFLRDHLVPNETYRLTKAELTEIGLLPDRYGRGL
mgnify:CR=1 FL=1